MPSNHQHLSTDNNSEYTQSCIVLYKMNNCHTFHIRLFVRQDLYSNLVSMANLQNLQQPMSILTGHYNLQHFPK